MSSYVRSCHALGVMVGVVLGSGVLAHAEAQRVYHIGNSVTDTINYAGLNALVNAGGHQYTMGRHMIPGAPLAWIYHRGADGNGDGTIGDYSGFMDNPQAPANAPDAQRAYRGALPGYEWEALTLQPFDRQLGTPTGALQANDLSGSNDLPVIREYVSLLRQNPASADTTVYIYSRWPRRDAIVDANWNVLGYHPFDYQQKWNRTYTGGWDGTNESQDYFERVTTGTREIVTNLGGTNPVFMVPVGDVLHELDVRMEAGQIPGYSDVVELYADGIHLTNAGSYVVGLTFYATMYQSDPNGLPIPAQYLQSGYGNAPPTPITAQQAAAFQDAVWDVVNGHPYSGVSVVIPEPATLGAVGGAMLILARRVRSR